MESIELRYEIRNGTVSSICQDKDTLSLIVSIKAVSNGAITLEIPRKIMNPMLENCEDHPFFVLLNGEEILQNRKNFGIDPYAETKSIYSRTLQIPFKTGSYEIEIIGTFIPENTMCVKKYQEKINVLPPRKQMTKGVLADEINCKESLQLIFKSRDNSPACVKPQTAQNLVERGWTSSL
jgi:hypothetical protein